MEYVVYARTFLANVSLALRQIRQIVKILKREKFTESEH